MHLCSLPGVRVYVDRVRRPLRQVSIEDGDGASVEVFGGGPSSPAESFAGDPEDNVLGAELLLEELCERLQPDRVGEELLEVRGPGASAANVDATLGRGSVVGVAGGGRGHRALSREAAQLVGYHHVAGRNILKWEIEEIMKRTSSLLTLSLSNYEMLQD